MDLSQIIGVDGIVENVRKPVLSKFHVLFLRKPENVKIST
jgi:hypothetical protein